MRDGRARARLTLIEVLTVIAYPLTNACRLIVPGLSYSPGNGLVESP